MAAPAAPDRSCGTLRLAHRAAGQGTRLAFGRGKEPRFRVQPYAFGIRRGMERFHVFVQIGFQLVMARHLVALAPFLVESGPSPAALHVDVFDAHFSGCRAHPRKGERHERDERTISQAHDGRCVDGVETFAGLVRPCNCTALQAEAQCHIGFAGPNILKALCFVEEGSVFPNGRRQRQQKASARVPTRHAGVRAPQ